MIDIKTLILKSGVSENIDIYRKTQVGEYLGSPMYKYTKIFTTLASVQPETSENEVDRLFIDDTPAGTKINDVYKVFSEIFNLENQDLVKRVEDDNQWYEVRPIKPYKNKIMIPHLMFHITKKDSQDVETV